MNVALSDEELLLLKDALWLKGAALEDCITIHRHRQDRTDFDKFSKKLACLRRLEKKLRNENNQSS
jgi:hypothetical protein